jgi:hypothetical protein
MSSPAQAAANRANAEHSTGPRTDEGKVSGVNYFSLSATTILPHWRQLHSLQSCDVLLNWCWPEQRIRLCRDAT